MASNADVGTLGGVASDLPAHSTGSGNSRCTHPGIGVDDPVQSAADGVATSQRLDIETELDDVAAHSNVWSRGLPR